MGIVLVSSTSNTISAEIPPTLGLDNQVSTLINQSVQRSRDGSGNARSLGSSQRQGRMTGFDPMIHCSRNSVVIALELEKKHCARNRPVCKYCMVVGSDKNIKHAPDAEQIPRRGRDGNRARSPGRETVPVPHFFSARTEKLRRISPPRPPYSGDVRRFLRYAAHLISDRRNCQRGHVAFIRTTLSVGSVRLQLHYLRRLFCHVCFSFFPLGFAWDTSCSFLWTYA